MSRQHLQLAGAAALLVDGIDVSQLLRDLGEASAASNAVELFGLCLTAQRVLVCMQAAGPAVGTGGSALKEAAWLAAFRNMNDRARENMLPAMQAIAENFPQRSLASLALVQPVQHMTGDAR